MGRIPAATTLLHGQRSKCADLTEQLPEKFIVLSGRICDFDAGQHLITRRRIQYGKNDREDQLSHDSAGRTAGVGSDL